MSRFALFTPESRAPSSTWTANEAPATTTTRQSTPSGMAHNSHGPFVLPSSSSSRHKQAGSNNITTAKNGTQTMPYDQLHQRLNFYYGTVKRQLMRHQDEASGLFRTHDDGATAHVRDNVYCAAALWSLSRAYQRIDNDNGRSRELSLCCVKTMRRILMLWMAEAHRLENFKNQQAPENALHCKFYVDSSLLPVPDRDYHHLQIDAVGLYMIFLTQMIASGLDIVFTSDEVNFVQNLVFYLERAYRTPDFGMWGRGNKYNIGQAELHASAIGTAKVALECINAFNLFGERGASWSVAYVDVDAHNRNRTTLESMLPRESNSKNTDAALLCTLSFPVFAMHTPDVLQTSMDKVRRKLAGRYGFKRFLRDGYGTAYDHAKSASLSSSRQSRIKPYYEPSEIHKFDGIESEWPIFFAYLIIDGVFHGDYGQVEHYQALLEPLLVDSNDGDLIIPKYYYVPEELVDAERRRPGSQHRLASGEDTRIEDDDASNDDPTRTTTFLWGQSVFIISQLLVEGLLHVNDLDPLRLHLPSELRYALQSSKKRYSSFSSIAAPHNLAVQVCLIAESVRLQRMLATYGIASQTPTQVEPIQIWSPTDLMNIYTSLGRNEALGLSGRPKRPFGTLSTSKVYRIRGVTVVCYPLFVDISDFYLSFDISVLMDDICSAFAFVAQRWSLHGRPTMVLLIREDNFSGPQASGMLNLLSSLRTGRVSSNGAHVKLGTLQTFLASSCVEQLDFIDSTFAIQHRIKPLKERAPSDANDVKNLLTGAIFDMVQRGQTPTPASGRALVDKRRMSIVLPAQENDDTPSSALRPAPPTQLNLTKLDQLCQQEVGTLLSALRSAAQYSSQAVLVLSALHHKEGPKFIVDSKSDVDTTVLQLMEKTIRFAASNGEWHLVRFCSAVMRKVVDSLAPSVSTMLVRGKLLTVGVFGQREIIIDKPITPAFLARAIYEACEPHDVTAACVQQEVILNVGKLIEAYPQLFDDILKIRIGWIVQAMSMYLSFTTAIRRRGSVLAEGDGGSESNNATNNVYDASDAATIDLQPPAVIKDLTVKVLCLPFEAQYETRSFIGRTVSPHGSVTQTNPVSGYTESETHLPNSSLLLSTRASLLTPHQRRQIDGCLGRVPERFYNYVWYILQRATDGIRIAGTILPQQPTLTEMSLSELRFALQVDSLLDRCMYPAYRQLVVELLLVINVILERNPECRFNRLLDTDELVVQALEKFVTIPKVSVTPTSSCKDEEASEINDSSLGLYNHHYYASFDDEKDKPVVLVKPKVSISRQSSSRQQQRSPAMKHYNEQANKFSEQEWQRFYNQPTTLTANFFAAAVANQLLDELRLPVNPPTMMSRGMGDNFSNDPEMSNLLPGCGLS